MRPCLIYQIRALVPSLHVLDGKRLEVYTQKSLERAATVKRKAVHTEEVETAPEQPDAECEKEKEEEKELTAPSKTKTKPSFEVKRPKIEDSRTATDPPAAKVTTAKQATGGFIKRKTNEAS